ncbi:MAG: hypothetical protein NVS1B11_00330 [Terriglobales bacterium]
MLLGMVVLHSAMLWKVHNLIFQGYGDFASFYTAGKIVQRGQSSHLYDRRLQWQIQQEFASTVKILRGPRSYIRPPFESLLFVPLAYFSYPTAHVIWTILNLAGLLAFPFLLSATPPPLELHPLLQGLLSLGFFPIAYDLLVGQDSILLLLIMACVFRFLLEGADFRSGLALGLGLFKFHLIIPLVLVFLLRKKFAVVLGFLATACVLFVLSIVLVGPGGLLYYPKYLWELDQAVGVGVAIPQNMPNLRGLLTPLFGYSLIPVWIHGVLIGLSVGGALVLACVWCIDRRYPKIMAAGFSLAIVVTILTSYYANSYDLTLMLLPILLLSDIVLESGEISGWPRKLFLSYIALLLFGPLWWVLVLRFGQFYWMALVLTGLAVSLGRTVIIWQRVPPSLQPDGATG